MRDRTHVDVLNYLANCADDDGGNCFPSVIRVARFTRCSERTVTRTIAELEKVGLLTVQRGDGRGKPSEYQINVQELKGCQDVTLSGGRKRVTNPQKRVTPTPIKGDIDANPPHPLLGDPSGNVIDPSLLPEEPAAPGDKGTPKAAPSKASDERFNNFRADHDKAFQHINHAPAPWDAKEATNLSRWLKANPTIDRTQWQNILRHRARSPVLHGEPLSAWIHRALGWLNAPTGGNANGRRNYQSKGDRTVAAIETALASVEARARARSDGNEPWGGSEPEGAGDLRGETLPPV